MTAHSSITKTGFYGLSTNASQHSRRKHFFSQAHWNYLISIVNEQPWFALPLIPSKVNRNGSQVLIKRPFTTIGDMMWKARTPLLRHTALNYRTLLVLWVNSICRGAMHINLDNNRIRYASSRRVKESH